MDGLKGPCHEIFDFRFFFRKSVSPKSLPPVSTTLAKMVAKFATGVFDTGGKFAAGVVDTGGNFANISDREFSKKFETVLMGYSGAGGN